MDAALITRIAGVSSGARWLALFVMTRALAVAVAGVVLSLHRVTDHDVLLAWVVVGYAVLTLVLALTVPWVFRRPAWWAADITAGLALVYASGDWRSPFYLLALTALAPAAANLPFRRALACGAGFTLAYFGVAVLTGLEPESFRSSVSIEIFATHLALPGVLTLGLAYAADVLHRLEDQQRRAQNLAVETERRRIAWELHDSAKQHLHAAHLVLSSLPASEQLELGLEQLRGAAADMETSIAELRSPLEGRPLDAALRSRAAELTAFGDDVVVRVEGTAPPLATVAANHAYRILAEAMTNAVRHAGAREVRVRLAAEETGGLRATVEDDGRGLPSSIRPGANGLRTMRSRAFAIGGRLHIGSGDHCGVRVDLEVPHEEGAPA